ncbi:MAG: hypothetical protein OXC61_07475 [Flavobacteriaceae bacterium]|nr:hypothetical protein [Flavobacteriaceae bacterium]
MSFVKAFVLFTFVSWAPSSFSQWNLSGVVTNEEGEPLSFCQVTLKKSLDSAEIIDYTFTDVHGTYELMTEFSGDLYLQFSKLYFHTATKVLSRDTSDQTMEFHVSLKPNPQKLEDVTLESTKPVIVKKDTVVYRAEHFRRGDEQVLEDLLENLPGVEVTSDGTVKVEGKEVEKIMIEGSDLVGDDYKLLSQNMPDYPVEEVELYRNYQENHLLRGLNDSGDVALNVLLDDQYQSVWFGNAKPQTDFDIDSKYQFVGNVMGIFQQTQSFITTQMNSIGQSSRASSWTLTDIDSELELLRPIIRMGSFRSRFGNANFNNQESVSFNSVFHPIETMEARVQMLFHWDEQSFLRTRNRNVAIHPIAFENKETYDLQRDRQGWTIHSRVKYELSEDQLLEYRGSHHDSKQVSDLSFDLNDLHSLEALSTKQQMLTQNIDYTLRISNSQVLQTNGYYAYQNQPQDYFSNQNFFEDLFVDSSMNRFGQKMNHRLDFATAKIQYIQKRSKNNLWHLGLQTHYRKESLENLTDRYLDLEIEDGIHRNQYTIWESQARLSRQWAWSDFKITPELHFSSVKTSLITAHEDLNATNYFWEGHLGFQWDFSERHDLSMGYHYAIHTISHLADITPDVLLLDRNSLQRGLGKIDFLNQSSFNVFYNISKPTQRMSFQARVVFMKQHDFITTNQTITPNYQMNELVLVQNQSMTNISSTTDYYLKKIFTNIKLKLSYSHNTYSFFIENEKNRLQSNHYGIGLEIRTSAFDDLDMVVGTNFRTPDVSVNGVSRPTVYATSQFLDVIYTPHRNITLKTVLDRSAYHTEETQEDFWLMNFHYDHILVRNKWTIGLEFMNLLNQKTFQSVMADNLGTTTSEYRIQPRIGLFKLEYRF